MLHGHHMKKRLSKYKSDIYFVYSGNINAKTGGYIYEKNILEYAKIRDINIRPIALSENYPFTTNNDIKYFLKILDKIDPESKIIIDGLALEGMYSIFKKILAATSLLIPLLTAPVIKFSFCFSSSVLFFLPIALLKISACPALNPESF